MTGKKNCSVGLLGLVWTASVAKVLDSGLISNYCLPENCRMLLGI